MSTFRQKWVSDPALKWFRRVLPPLSATEKEAMEAGSVWWEGELFSGRPNFSHLLEYTKPQLSDEEQAFIDNELEILLSQLDDYHIMHREKDLPESIWNFLREQRFFSLIIEKEYGGRAFSAYANSTIVTKIATRSISAAVTVMVPNSLGPGELLTQYGTKEQKEYWLPRLADGRDIPCFALTGPEAGSDAGSIPDKGIVCRGEYQGKEVLGIRLTWNKRYITLAPVATVLGLAFKLYDPDGLIGEKSELGITCALIPTSHPGVEIGERHDPMGLAFMNGPTRGKDVFIPIEWIIGGQEYAGKGWRMLVECLSAGRGISLPALGAAIGHLASRTTGAYAYVRKQFGVSIGRFEGVGEALGRIGGLTYLLEATRTLTTTALDSDEKPGVVTAIAKYHMTEMGRTILADAMDIHAGRAIQGGPMNYLSTHYLGIPIAITVEGANILTRNLMIFGQGATRCHPFVLKEMAAAADPETERGAKAFDRWLFQHIGHTAGNMGRALGLALTGSRWVKVPSQGATTREFQHLSRLCAGLAVTADMAMLTLGGALKRKELISARLGDALAYLYMASAALKRFADEGEQVVDRPYLDYALAHCYWRAANAMKEALINFPNGFIGSILRGIIFPLGQNYAPPKDAIALEIAQLMMIPGEQRDRMTHLCFVGKDKDDAIAIMDNAFVALYEVKDIEKRLQQAIVAKKVDSKLPLEEKLNAAEKVGVMSANERRMVLRAEQLRYRAIQVDHFSHDLSEVLTNKGQAPTL